MNNILIENDPAGSVPRQSHLATGGLQTLWRLSSDGRSIERFDSTSLRLRAVDTAGTAGYVAISAATSDGSAWALDNEGYACLYEAGSNRFVRQDGSGSGDDRRLNLGSGWRQIVAARGSNTAPVLWLLRDAPGDGGSTVAYVPGALAEGQTLADLKPITVAGGPQLRLLAVGDDQTPWGIDQAGDLWRWDAASENFEQLAAGVGAQIRQLQMIDQGTVWALDERGVLQMWDDRQRRFNAVPLDSPFFTRRSDLLTPGVTPTWESFSLSALGGFVGIPRSGVTLPAGGNGLVTFDTSEIRMLRDPSENPSQLQLLGGETLQDNGVRQRGQNLAFNLNDQVAVAYLLNGSQPGQWEGAAVVPNAQSGADLSLQPGPNRDAKGARLPVLKLRWLSDLGDEGRQEYSSLGYVSPFGGLVFAPAEREQRLRVGASFSTASGLPAKAGIGTPEAQTTVQTGLLASTQPGPGDGKTVIPVEYNSEFALVFPNIGGASSFRLWGTDKTATLPSGWKFKFIVRGRIGGYSQPEKQSQIQARLELRGEFSRENKKAIAPWSIQTKKFAVTRAAANISTSFTKSIFTPVDSFRKDAGSALKEANTAVGLFFYSQTDARWDIGQSSPTRVSEALGTEFRVTFPLYSFGKNAFQLGLTLGAMVDYAGTWTKQTFPLKTDSAYATSTGFAEEPVTRLITFIDKRTGLPITDQTPQKHLVALVDPSQSGAYKIASTLADVVPPLAFMTDVLAPALQTVFNPSSLLSGALSKGSQPWGENAFQTLSALSSPQARETSNSIDTLTSATEKQENSQSDTAQPIDSAQSDTPVETTNYSYTDTGRLRPYAGLQLKASTAAIEANIHARFIPYLTFPPLTSTRFVLRIDVEIALLASFTYRERLNLDFTKIIKGEPSRAQLAAEFLEPSPESFESSLLATQPISRDLSTYATSDDTTIPTPIAQLVRADGSAFGIITRLLPGNTGLFELSWVQGQQRADGLSIVWDASSLQSIDGSSGITTDIQLIELENGRLAISASHIAADDPLLQPITQLGPGSLYRIDAQASSLGSTNALTEDTPRLGLPAGRVWAQLGSSLASSGALRSDWSGDSLIAGASGSKDGAGALYILNGTSLAGLSDLSALENNSRLDQGLVILGSHQSGSLSGLGQLVVNGGDTNADGFSEILASAPHDLDGAGLVYMLYGGRALELLPTVKRGSIDLDDLDALQADPRTQDQFLQTFRGVSGSSGYGTILAGGRDHNGDGHTDLLIGYAADPTLAGSVELWSSRADLRQQSFLGLDGSGQQSIPHFDRSVFASARSPLAGQSDFHLHAASAVGDVNADGHGDIVLSSDNQAALVFGDALMPVYWEVSSVLGSIAASVNPGGAAAPSQTWTASWKDAAGRRIVLSFHGSDSNGDGRLSSETEPGGSEIDWLALRIDSPDGEPLVALSGAIADQWQGAQTISSASLNFDLTQKNFTSAVTLEASADAASDGNGSFRWASDGAGVNLDQSARSLQARLITSKAPGVLNAAGIGDFNRDGWDDLALSQAGYRIPDSDGTGLVFQPGQTAMLFGDPGLASSGTPLAVEQTSAGSTGVLLDAGGELSAIGDWNADGQADLLIRDPSADGSAGEQVGRSVVLLGRPSSDDGRLNLATEQGEGRAQVLEGSEANSRSGTSAASGDFAGDGGGSLFLGAPNTISEGDLRQAAAGVRVFTATQNRDGTWRTPQQIPLPQAAGLQELSSFTAVGNQILATWVRTSGDGQGGLQDEFWAAFQNGDGQWQPATLLQTNRRQDAGEITLGEVNGLALTDAQGQPSGGVLLAWTCLDPATGRSFLFQSTYAPAMGWSQAQQQDLQALLLANEDAISGSQLKLQLNPGTPEQRSQVWAEAGISSEGDASARITLMRAGDLSQPLTLNYSTRDQSASAGSQYQDSQGAVQFAAGEASVTLAIPLLDNGNLEYRTTSFAVDFSLPADQLATARPQLLLGDTPVARDNGLPILSVSAGVQDNESIRMRAIDAGISLLAPLTESTGEAATASTDQALQSTIALVADPGAREGLGQVYALFVAATASDTANPGLDWKELNAIPSLDQPTTSIGEKTRQLNVLIQTEEALTVRDPRAGFGTAMVKLTLQGRDYFAISAPGNPLDGTKPGRVFVVAASTIQAWADSSQTASQPLILNEGNSLIIEQMTGGLFGSALAAADLDGDNAQELIIGAPGSSSVFVIAGTALTRPGRPAISSLNPKVITDPNSTADGGSTGFGTAITALNLDGDQWLDLAIGAPRALPVRARTVFDGLGPIVANAGAVYVVQGSGEVSNFQGDVSALVGNNRALMLKGQAKVNDRDGEDDPPRPASEGLPPPGSFGFGEELGSALAAVDLNSDQVTDLAIGAPQYTPDDILRTGRVVTWFGSKDPGWGQSIDLRTMTPAKGVAFVGQQDGARVGASLAAAGDLQGDANQDLAIGAPFEEGGAGRVYVAFGSQNRYGSAALTTTGNNFALDATSADSPFQTFEAPDGYQLGRSVARLGDINNDAPTGIGGDDLFLGSPAAVAPREVTNDKGDLQLEPAGQTHLAWGRPWLGPNQSLDVPFTQGVGYLLPFGGVPMALGDLNGDGYSDYALLGSQADAGDATPADQATLLRLRFGAAVEYEQRQLQLSAFSLSPAESASANDRVPQVVAGDFDGDGFGDLAALTDTGLKLLNGAPNLPLRGDSQGRLNEPGTTISTGANLTAMVSGDFDGDGYDDLVQLSGSTTLQVFWGSGAGLQAGASIVLKKSPLISNRAWGIDAIKAVDSNGDGVEELAVLGRNITEWSDAAESNLYLLELRRQSDNPFSRALSSLFISGEVEKITTALSAGDLNGDGRQDLLLDRGGRDARVLLGQQNGRFQQSLSFNRQPPGTSLSRYQLARFIGDVNGDGRDDVLFSPTSTQDFSTSTYKYGPYSFIYLGSSSTSESPITLPHFWDKSDNAEPRDLRAWSPYGFSIESLPGEADPYRTGSLGDVNGDGFDEVLFSSNRLVVNGQPQASRPHSVAIYGSNRLTPTALASTASNDGSSLDDTLHQLGSAGKQELLLRGKAGSDLLQVHADPYGATLSIPDDGANAGRLTVSASNGDTLWSQPRNPYELALRDGQLQIIRTSDSKVVKTWGGGDRTIDRVVLAANGWLYFLKAGVNDDQFRNPNGWNDLGKPAEDLLTSRKGILGMAGWFENDATTIFEVQTQVYDSQLVFSPATGALYLVNRQAQSKNGDKDRDNWSFDALSGDFGRQVSARSAAIALYNGDPKAAKDSATIATQILNPGESLFNATGAQKLNVAETVPSLDALQISRRDLVTFVGNGDDSGLPFGIRRATPAQHDRSLADIFRGTTMATARDDLAWAAPGVQQAGPYLAVMDGNGRLTINAQQVVDGQIKPGSELQVLHEGNPDPFLPPLGSQPVLIPPDTPTDQVSQSIARSTNNSFSAVLKGGLDDDRLGIDSLERFRSRDGQPAGLVDGGPGVDTLFFSSQSSDRQDPSIDLVGFGGRIRNIEAIEIPINNVLELDEAPLLNTPLHRLKLNSRGAAKVIFEVRTAYQYIGDQLDAGLAYSVYAKPDSNLQLWVQQGRITLSQRLNADGSSASLASRPSGSGEGLSSGDPIDADGLAVNPAYAYRWYRDGQLIAGATQASYGVEVLQSLEPGRYVRETDYTDRSGLRQTVVSTPIVVEPDQAVAGGILRVRRSQLDARQRDQLPAPGDGWQPWPELLYLDFQAEPNGGAASVQRLTLQPPAADDFGSGLVALLSPDGAALPPAADLYDLDGDGRVDSLTWLPGEGSGGSSLEAALLTAPSPAALLAQEHDLGFLLPGDLPGNWRLPALQSLRLTLAASPQQVVSLVAIPLAEGETVEGLTPTERQQRALALLSNQDANPAPLAGGADRERSLWLRTDQRLALLELQGSTPQDWDGASGWQRLVATTADSDGASSLRFQSDSGLVVDLSVETSAQDLNGLLARSQTTAPVLDFRGLDGLPLSGTLKVAREADYNSQVGFHAIDDLNGAIRDPITRELVAPGDSRYAALALARRIEALDGLQSDNRSSRTEALSLEESRLLAPYAVVEDPRLGATTYFAFAAANPDGRSHFRSFGTNVIGLEDQAGGGDNDFDDLLFHLELQPLL